MSATTQKPSDHSTTPTLDRLEAALKERGFTIFTRIDHAAAAAAMGLKMPASTGSYSAIRASARLLSYKSQRWRSTSRSRPWCTTMPMSKFLSATTRLTTCWERFTTDMGSQPTRRLGRGPNKLWRKRRMWRRNDKRQSEAAAIFARHDVPTGAARLVAMQSTLQTGPAQQS